MKQIGAVLLFTILAFSSCHVTKETAGTGIDEPKSSLTMAYYQTPGNNALDPEYSIELFSNKQMVLEAKKNLDKSGKYMRTLSAQEYKHLLKTFVDADFFKFEPEYTDTVSNLPTRYLYFAYQGHEKKIKDYFGAPETLTQLEYSIQSFLDRVGWEKMTW
ncbi:MAG: DUF6438 domain-containing protein [Salinivirgaceae bacterium]